MKISIIVPSYNIVKLGLEPINKLKTFIDKEKQVEIIYIDDGSVDETVSFIKENYKNDKRIKVYSQENKGLAATRVEGLKKVSKDSTHVIFLDADDNLEGDITSLLTQKNSDNTIFAFRSTVNRNEERSEYLEIERFTTSLFERFIFGNAIHGYAFPKRILNKGLTTLKITFEDVLYVKWAKEVDVNFPNIKIENLSSIKKVVNVLDTSLSREININSKTAQKKISDLKYVWNTMWTDLKKLDCNNKQLRYLFIGKFILEYYHIAETINVKAINEAYKVIPKIKGSYKKKVNTSYKWKIFTFILRLRVNFITKILISYFMS